MTTYTWKVSQLERESSDGYVFTAHWTVNATETVEDKTYTAGAYGGNIGIGTTNPTKALTVRGGDISVGVSTSHGVILTSPNGTQYRLIVNNAGDLSTVAV